jgi:hypothetical protein
MDLQVVASRLLAVPYVVEELIGGQGAPSREREVDEYGAGASAADVERVPFIVEHLERTEDAQFQAGSHDTPALQTDETPQAIRQRVDSVSVHRDRMSTYADLSVSLARHAWNACLRGNLVRAAQLAEHAARVAADAPRRERQMVEIVRLAIAGEVCRACDLAAEHLSEFPCDDIVRSVRTACQ